MFFHVKIFLYSLIFLVILEFISTDFISSPLGILSDKRNFFLVLIFLGLFFYFFQVARKISRKLAMTPVPVFFVIGTFGLLYFITARWQQHFFIVLCSFIYYFIHLALYRLRSCQKDKTAIGVLSAGNVASIFLMYSVAYGIYLNFAISLWIFMLAIMLITITIGFQFFLLINENKRAVLNYSVILGLIMAEMVWVLNFWPFGYLTTSVCGLIFYFVFWDVIQCYFLQKLSKRRIVANMVFLGVIIAIVLSSTRWLPAV